MDMGPKYASRLALKVFAALVAFLWSIVRLNNFLACAAFLTRSVLLGSGQNTLC